MAWGSITVRLTNEPPTILSLDVWPSWKYEGYDTNTVLR